LIKILFNYKLNDLDFKKKELIFEKRENESKTFETVQADRVLGADGL